MTPLYCRKCGTRLPADSLFCSTCGTSQTANDHAPTNLPEQESPIIGTGRLPLGRMLHQRYRLLHTVGQGGMGAVYMAQDTQLGDRLVAVKEMSMSRLTPQELPHAVEQFRSEAHLLASLHHPNLPAIHEYFSEDDRWYLVMSFIEGQSLQTALGNTPGKKFPLKDTVQIGIELCEVLDYLHSHVPQIIFRDLKPSNIMLTPKSHVCLIDFGIARHFKQEQTKDTAYYYSVGYAPPEQYGQSQTSPCSDIYSLGATLHQMLSGQNPASKPFQFSPLQLVDPTLPAPLAQLITQMLEMNEQSRPAHVTEVKTRLEQILTPVQKRPSESQRGTQGEIEKTTLSRFSQLRQSYLFRIVFALIALLGVVFGFSLLSNSLSAVVSYVTHPSDFAPIDFFVSLILIISLIIIILSIIGFYRVANAVARKIFAIVALMSGFGLIVYSLTPWGASDFHTVAILVGVILIVCGICVGGIRVVVPAYLLTAYFVQRVARLRQRMIMLLRTYQNKNLP